MREHASRFLLEHRLRGRALRDFSPTIVGERSEVQAGHLLYNDQNVHHRDCFRQHGLRAGVWAADYLQNTAW